MKTRLEREAAATPSASLLLVYVLSLPEWKLNKARDSEGVERLLATPGLANALESDRFKQFLDHVPVAIAVSDVGASEAIFGPITGSDFLRMAE